jgi:iron complex transport system substrate-binding protein
MLRAMVVALLLGVCAGRADAAAPARIVSLAPNMTEIVFALGLGDRLVGVTTFCTYPPEARLLPKVGGMSNPSLEAIVRARPDIVLMTTDGNPQGVDVRLRDMGIEISVSRARTLGELPGEIRRVAGVLGVSGRGEELARGIEGGLRELHDARGGRGQVVFVIWPEPLMVAGEGSLVDDAMRHMGYENAGAGTGVMYPRFSVEELVRRAPDHVVLGAAMDQLGGEGGMRALAARLGDRLAPTPAGRAGGIRFVGDALYRLGPRVVAGMRELRDAIEGTE